jgi:hypothetical protein
MPWISQGIVLPLLASGAQGQAGWPKRPLPGNPGSLKALRDCSGFCGRRRGARRYHCDAPCRVCGAFCGADLALPLTR